MGKRIYHIQRLLAEAERIMQRKPPLVWHEDGTPPRAEPPLNDSFVKS